MAEFRVTVDLGSIARFVPLGFCVPPSLDHLVGMTNKFRHAFAEDQQVFACLLDEVAHARGLVEWELSAHELGGAVALWTRANPAASADIAYLSVTDATRLADMLTELSAITRGQDGLSHVDESRDALACVAAVSYTDYADDRKVLACAAQTGCNLVITNDQEMLASLAYDGCVHASGRRPRQFANMYAATRENVVAA